MPMDVPKGARSLLLALVVPIVGCGGADEIPTPRPASLDWVDQTTGSRGVLRGASAVSDLVAWASGGSGTVLRTVDGGATWQSRPVPDRATAEFRDIEALSAEVAWVMSVGPGDESRIYKTVDGGVTWALQFANDDPAAFFISMAFWDARRGIAVADGVDGRFIVITTDDGGETWTPMSADDLPPALDSEGFWAASGTNVALMGDNRVWLATGGAVRSRVIRSDDGGLTWEVVDSPIVSGGTIGARSIAFRDPMHGISVGGDSQNHDDAVDNIALTRDGGVTWTLVRGADRKVSALTGNRTAVSYVPGTDTVLAVGQNGADVSRDDGLTWTRIEIPVLPDSPVDYPGLLGLTVSPSGRVAWAVGGSGRIMRVSGF